MIFKTKGSYYKIVVGVIIMIFILSPAFLYAYKFGSSLSTSHDIWGQFGSYISGIYTPLLSFLTLFLLYKQNETQVKMNNYHREYNDATQFRADASFYINNLVNTLTADTTDSLKGQFTCKTTKDLQNIKSGYANRVHSYNPKILNAWIGFNTALKGLNAYKKTSFEHHYNSVKDIPITLFGFDFCVILDNYCHIQTDKKMVFNEYSDVVSS